MAHWWDGDADERYWVEIRGVPGIGIDLECPDHQVNHDGSSGRNPWYELVRSVRRGDIIYHYNEREQRFVGRSVAAADAEHDATEQSYVVELENFTPITALVDLSYMRERGDVLRALREDLQAAHPGETLYTPFQFRESGLYGMMSNYFAKLPRAVVGELFGVDGLAESLLPVGPADDASGAEGEPSGGAAGHHRRGFLHPFKAKADADYMTHVIGGRLRRSRNHERLINDCADWLAGLGYEPMRNAAVDLGLDDPPLIIEGKTIASGWAPPVRQAVSQLYEYRYFRVASPASSLIFLSERKVPNEWVRYLEKDREIGVMWPTAGGYELSARARQALRL